MKKPSKSAKTDRSRATDLIAQGAFADPYGYRALAVLALKSLLTEYKITRRKKAPPL